MLFFGGYFGLHYFEGDSTLQPQVFGFEDDSHAALAEQLQDPVAIEPADFVAP